MRCYYVLVHGSLDWLGDRTAQDEMGSARPVGFYCHRYLLAADEAEATKTAFQRVLTNLDTKMGWVRDGLATVELEAEEVNPAPIYKLLKRENRGHTFYTEAECPPHHPLPTLAYPACPHLSDRIPNESDHQTERN